MTTTTFLVNHGGYVSNSGSVFSTVRSAGTGSSVVADCTYGLVGTRSDGGSYYFERAFFNIDTSAIGAGSTITSATFYFYRNTRDDVNSHNDSGMVLVANSSSSNTTLGTSDFGSVGSTRLASDLTGLDNTNPSYNWTTFTLNSAGLSAISKTGYTKLCVRTVRDVDNNSSGVATNTQPYHLYYGEGNTDDTSKKPYLEVTYTAGATGNTAKFLLLF